MWVFSWKDFFRDFNFPISCINYYGPYCNREDFWNRVEASGFINYPNIIFVGDLNFTLTEAEMWGDYARSDPLGTFFAQLF